jgi:hypothetical protein
VNTDGVNSVLFILLLGTVQGPVLYAIYFSPMFDKFYLLSFVDDKYIPRWSKLLPKLITETKKINQWLKKSGSGVNEA